MSAPPSSDNPMVEAIAARLDKLIVEHQPISSILVRRGRYEIADAIAEIVQPLLEAGRRQALEEALTAVDQARAPESIWGPEYGDHAEDGFSTGKDVALAAIRRLPGGPE